MPIIILKDKKDKTNYSKLFESVYYEVRDIFNKLSLSTKSFCSEYLDSEEVDFLFEINYEKGNNDIHFPKKILNEINDYIKSDATLFKDVIKKFPNLMKQKKYMELNKIINEIYKEFKYNIENAQLNRILNSLNRSLINLNNELGYFKAYNNKQFKIVIFINRINEMDNSNEVLKATLAHEYFHLFHYLSCFDNNSNTNLFSSKTKTYKNICSIITESCATIFELIFAHNYKYNDYFNYRLANLKRYSLYDFPYSGAANIITNNSFPVDIKGKICSRFLDIYNLSFISIERVLCELTENYVYLSL